jgi:hypothetical protein
MSKKVLYVATTNHGFGHTTRTASAVAAIQQLDPDIAIIMATTAPRWLLEQYIQGDFIHHTRALDVGIIQSDSLTIDKSATLEQLLKLRAEEASTVSIEVDFIKQHQVALVLADIPHLAVRVAHEAGLPCWMTSNFGWDFIYRAWGGEFAEIANWISDCYSECDRLLRIPFHESMSAFTHITDVGLTGGVPRYSIPALRSDFNLNKPVEQTVLLTFGGGGLNQIPYHNLQNFPDQQFITFDNEAPICSNLLKVTGYQYKPVDFMPLCNRIISKPGYSTFAEACRLEIPVISITREDFAESIPLLEGIQDYAYHQILKPEEFFQGNWEFLWKSISPPRQSQSMSKDGNQEIARAVVSYLSNY